MSRNPAAQPPKKLRLLLVDDHPIVRDGVRSCLADSGHLEIVGEAGDGLEAIEMARTLRPDVVLLDISMPRMSGLEALPGLRSACPTARVLMLTVHESREYLREARRAGADGYLLKDSAPADYLAAIAAVMAGRWFVSPAVGKIALSLLDSQPVLSAHQLEYVRLAAAGLSAAAIAEKMGCSIVSVRTHRRRVLEKLSLPDLPSLVRHAAKQGWLENILNIPISGD